MSRPWRAVLVAIPLLMGLAACGQMGPLYLPGEAPGNAPEQAVDEDQQDDEQDE